MLIESWLVLLVWINVFPEKVNHLVAYGYHTSHEGPTRAWQRMSAIQKWIISVWHCVRARVCVMDWAHESQSQRCVCAFVHGCICVCVCVCVRERVRTSFGHLSHFERKKSCFGVFSTNRGFHRKIPHMLKVFPQARLECQRSAFVELITCYIFSLFYGVKWRSKVLQDCWLFFPPPPTMLF